MTTTGRFAVAVTCIDGRIQSTVAESVRRTHGVSYVDMVTVPGIDGALLDESAPARRQVRDAVRVSVTAHDSHVAVVAGHTDCAGHPVDEPEHGRDVRQVVEWLRAEFPELIVLGALVDTASGQVRPV
jgi:hypothetical protein